MRKKTPTNTVSKRSKQVQTIWAMSLYYDHLRKYIEEHGVDLYIINNIDTHPHIDQFGNLYVSRSFIDKLDEQQLDMFFLHEAGHLYVLFSELSIAALIKQGIEQGEFKGTSEQEVNSYARFLRSPNEPMVDLFALTTHNGVGPKQLLVQEE